jgi:hypothetical protein
MRSIRASKHGRERRVGSVRCGVQMLGLALALAGCGSGKSSNGNGFFADPAPGSDAGVRTDAAAVPIPGIFSGQPSNQPDFGQTAIASVPPPPISGGTLLATRDGIHAIAADPERDGVYVVNLVTHAVDFTVALKAGDEPGRVVEDGAGRIHVALRSGGALATIDPWKGTLIGRRDVCSAPRGIAWDAATDLVWVACATGELVALPAAGGPAAHTFAIERDLRDVIVSGGSVAVTKFRSAEVLRIASDGSITRRDRLPSPQQSFAAHVAWRSVAGPSGTVVAVHQAESTASVSVAPGGRPVQGGYGGGGCSGQFNGAPGGFSSGPGPLRPPPPPPPPPPTPVVSFDDAGMLIASVDAGAQSPAFDAGVTVTPPTPTCLDVAGGRTPPTFFSQITQTPQVVPGVGGGCLPSGVVLGVLTALGPDGSVVINTPFPAVLPLDVAVSPDGSAVAAVGPGNAFASGLDTVFLFSACGLQQESTQVLTGDATSEQPIAVAFRGSDRLLVQTREPAELRIYGPSVHVTIPLSSVSRKDTGHDVFHTQAGAMIACASCHPEGRDDGHVWILDGSSRRTPSLQGTIAGTAPYHWPGDQADLNVLVNDVYTVRMSGAVLPDVQRSALTGWVQAIPAPAAPVASKSSAAQRGRALFERADVGCAGCHSGPKFTNNTTVDVGTGGAFQVPPLVGVGWRTPLMHDGCAVTIADRFGACATAGHGSTGSLSASDISDLVSYLETL